MKLISWNVNGYRAAMNKGFEDFFKNIDADIFCIQESKMQENQLSNDLVKFLNGYYCKWYSAERRGYSGTGAGRKKRDGG